jgi:hypothetical protein
MDPNFRYPVATVIGGQPFWEKALVARIRERIYGDRRFESISLQWRVGSELDFRDPRITHRDLPAEP